MLVQTSQGTVSMKKAGSFVEKIQSKQTKCLVTFSILQILSLENRRAHCSHKERKGKQTNLIKVKITSQ